MAFEQRAALSVSASRDVAAAAAASPQGPGKTAPLKSLQERIGFIGAGQMGEALIRGFLRVS